MALIVSTTEFSATKDALYPFQLDVTGPNDVKNDADRCYAVAQAPASMTMSATGVIVGALGDGGSHANPTVTARVCSTNPLTIIRP